MNSNLLVGIAMPTRNSDMAIRQLEYYADLKSPHPVYIGDAGDEENSRKLKNCIARLSRSISINYFHHPVPEFSLADSQIELYSNIKEKYCVFVGDDDYQVPSSLTKCAEFLEKNENYTTASGYAVSFRLKNNGVYGELKRIANYPRRQIELPTAAERLNSFMSEFRVNLFSVHRTEVMRKCWSWSRELKEFDFATEILPCAMSVVLGKSKIIDCLGFVRQIHNKHIPKNPTVLDWIAQKDWLSSYEKFRDVLSATISTIDNISVDVAKNCVRNAMWAYISKTVVSDFPQFLLESNSLRPTSAKRIKSLFGNKIPLLKILYKRWLKKESIKDLHYLVIQEYSKYYNDFKPVTGSFSGTCNRLTKL